MKILHVVEASFAGVGRHVLDLAGAQAAVGHQVHVAYSPVRESSSFASERADLGAVRWHAVPMSRGLRLVDVPAAARLAGLVRSTKPDVVHGHSTKGGLMARVIPVGAVPTVYTPNAVFSMNPLLGGRARRVIELAERALSRRTAAIIAVSPEERAHFEADIGVDPATVTVIPNGIQPVEPADPTIVRKELDLPVDRPIVGFVGRLDRQKAPDDLLKIYARMAHNHPTAHFVVVGDGPMGPNLRAMWPVAGSALDERLHFLGEQPGTWAMSGFDLLVLPSRYEGFPYVLIEAANLGLPIVTTDRACASLLVDGPANVAIGSVGDVNGLAELALRSLRSLDPFQARDLRFTVQAMAERTIEVYRMAVGRSTPDSA